MTRVIARALGALFGALLVVVASGVRADAQSQASEYELKAAFLYNFAKFVEWPDAVPADGPICIGVLGEDPFGATLDRLLAGKTVHDRPVAVRRFPTAEAVVPCHLVFVSEAAARSVPSNAFARTGVLSVGETNEFLAQGGVIAFRMEGNKLRFAVNAAAAERARLKLSSQLLKLATHVRTEGD